MIDRPTITTTPAPAEASKRAVANYRTAAGGEAAIERQRKQVRAWAEKNQITIVREFADVGKSGLDAAGRPAFMELMEEWVKKDRDFRYILCEDIGRWGRSPDADWSVQYMAECAKAGKQVICTATGQPPEDDPWCRVYVQLKRSFFPECCTLGRRIRRGRMRAAQQGYWTGGNPPYGLRRLLLDHQGNPLHLLEPGQRKTIWNHRVALVVGDPAEVAAIRRMFHEFVDLGYTTARIADGLNAKRIPSPGGDRWTARQVLACLRTKAYARPITYRRKRTASRRGKVADRWVRTQNVREGIISPELLQRAQEMLAEAKITRPCLAAIR